jgi:predicted site-specific integrase-resolvase
VTNTRVVPGIDSEWVPAAQFRREFGISRTTEWRWARDGIISEPCRIAGRRYYPRAVIDDLKRRSAQPGGAQKNR